MLRTLRFVLAFAMLASFISVAQAGAITVDNGGCALSQAIAAANVANGAGFDGTPTP